MSVTAEYEVRYHEVDRHMKAPMTTIMDYFNDIAELEGTIYNGAVDIMGKENLAWILLKGAIKVNEYPSYLNRIKVETVPISLDKFYAFRKFYIFGEGGAIFVDASSQWILLDMKRRRPSRVKDYMYDLYNLSRDVTTHIDISDPEALERVDCQKSFRVRASDIDMYDHVHNVVYASWINESVPVEITSTMRMKEFTINYKRETGYGSRVDVITQVNGGNGGTKCIHNIKDSDGKLLTVAESRWEFFK